VFIILISAVGVVEVAQHVELIRLEGGAGFRQGDKAKTPEWLINQQVALMRRIQLRNLGLYRRVNIEDGV
jgi:hypothetical protein